MNDLSIAHADDALLDALSGADPKIADELGEAELNSLLLSWRREVDGEPMPELVDTATAVTTIKAATLARKHGTHGRKHRMLIPFAAAAAVLAITFTGTGVVAWEAQPGDTLWGLTQVLYADKARSVQAATDVRADFEFVRTAISRGQLDAAREALGEARIALNSVAVEDNREELVAEHDALMTRVDEGEKPPLEPATTAPPEEADPPLSTSPEEPTVPAEPVQPAPEPSTSPSTPPPSSTPEPEPSTSPSSTTSAEGETSDSTSGMGATDDTSGDTTATDDTSGDTTGTGDTGGTDVGTG